MSNPETTDFTVWWAALNLALAATGRHEATLDEARLLAWWRMTPETAAKRLTTLDAAAGSLFGEIAHA